MSTASSTAHSPPTTPWAPTYHPPSSPFQCPRMGRDRTPSSLLSSTARGASWLAAPGLTRYSVPSNHPTSFFLRKQIGLSTTRTVQDESVVYELRYPCPEL